MLGSVLAALASFFVTGALARFAVPGPDPMPLWLTLAIGLVGTLIGGAIVIAVVGSDPAWVGTCRDFTVKFRGGSLRTIRFKFVK